MKIIFKDLLVFVSLFCVMSCQKKDNTPADLSKVNVVFNSPFDGQTFHKGDTINFNSYVTYISELKGVGLEIIDTVSGSQLFEEDNDLHTDHFSIGGSWVDTVSDNKILQVKVSVFVASNTTVPAVRSIYIKTVP
jgi:hypothetical protein